VTQAAVAEPPTPAAAHPPHPSGLPAPAPRPVPEHLQSERRPLGAPWDKLMMWLFLGSDAMGFAGLLGAYAALRMGDDNWPIPQRVLGINFTALMTFVLICSSVTMVKSFEAIQKDDRVRCWKFLFATFLGGVFFLAGQCYEYTHLIEHGVTLRSSNFAATFFCTTGFHGCHVLGGVILLGIALAKVSSGAITSARANFIENVGLYWHFVDLIWILVFTFIYLV
jgi:heme/copper-type cytochrome/quinol oxidase subunit 3